jgi:bifunctional non-homologous end joining protein LigD
VLRGRRLRGEWHLVQTKREGGRDWLLFKARDRYAGSGSDLFAGVDLSRAKRGPAPRRPGLMEPVEGFEPFSDPAWVFEPAFVGQRVLAAIGGAETSLRVGKEDLAPRLPRLVKELESVRAETVLLDGVLVALDAQGRPSREALERCLAGDGQGVLLYLCDALYAEEWDLRTLPLRERKAALRDLLPELPHVLLVDPIAERGAELAEAAAGAGFAAIVAKRGESPYRAGPSEDWRLIAVGGRKPARATARAAAAPAPAPLTNPRKVYWPEQGYTKADLHAYYDRIADHILPYLRERPLHL